MIQCNSYSEIKHFDAKTELNNILDGFLCFSLISGSQDLNRPAPPTYAKFSSLDRRALARRHHSNNNTNQHLNNINNNNPHLNNQQQQQHQTSNPAAAKPNSNPLKLSTFTPPELATAAVAPPQAQPGTPHKQPGSKCQPERRHSSYNPASSLARTPSQNSEYRYKQWWNI